MDDIMDKILAHPINNSSLCS